jgi:site-specific DNA recombinase
LYTLNREGKYDGVTELHISILANRAQEEVRTLKTRIKSGLRYSVSNSGAGTGIFKPFGFKNLDTKLVVDKDEAKIVQEMFNLYLKGLGASQISAHLNGKGIKTRYQKALGEQEIKTKSGIVKKGSEYSWSDGTIITMLKHSIYKGDRKFAGDVLSIPAIVEPIVFDQVQLMMKKRHNRPIRTIVNDNFLKGLIKCG